MKHKHVWIIGLLALAGCEPITEDNPVFEPVDECPNNPNKTKPGVCGCDVDDVIDALTGMYQCIAPETDLCPSDPNKTTPGICGCNVADTLNSNGIPLCLVQSVDFCPDDPNKTLPGICGCGVEDSIGDTGVADCLSEQMDLCPEDPDKKLPGVCGCGVPDDPDPETGAPKCMAETIDFCPLDDNKTRPGVCDCGTPDIDSDGDTVLDCKDVCPEDVEKWDAGMCGCGVPDSDENLADIDSDGVINCLDFCPENPWKSADDGCSCEQLFYKLPEYSGCANIIAAPEDFIALRDSWNYDDSYGEGSDSLAYIMVADINLGDVLTQEMATSWEGLGTEYHPFNAIFVGNGYSFTGIKRTGAMTQTLTFGNESADYVALFGYTQEARFDSIRVNVAFTGNSHVAGLVAKAERTTITNIETSNTVSAKRMAGAIAGEIVASSVSNVISRTQVNVANEYAGGAVAYMSDSQLSNVKVTGDVKGGTYTGGVVGLATKASRVSSVFSTGHISGTSYTGGLIAELSTRSQFLNAYTSSEVTCLASPCASVLASINDFSTVKNVYTTGELVNQIPEEPVEPEEPEDPPVDPEEPKPEEPDNPVDPENPNPETPEEPDNPNPETPENPGDGTGDGGEGTGEGSGEGEGTGEGSGEGTGEGSGEGTGEGSGEGEDTGEGEGEGTGEDSGGDAGTEGEDGSEDGSGEGEGTEPGPGATILPIKIPAASLIASFGSLDNVVDMLYYWNQFEVEPIPLEYQEKLVLAMPRAFSYVALRPQLVETSTHLLTQLNNNLTCNAGVCTLDGTACLSWVVGSHKLSHTSMTVKLPMMNLPIVMSGSQ